ncbi:MAG: hypothetical protein KJN79_01605 [Gammaproteobacteria bacterium]|nr:hypothetical protein [Gammaproteobacteria bacterium]
MSEVMILMSAILAGELLLVLLVLLSYAWFRNRALRRRDTKAIRVLATRIKNSRTERETKIARFLGEQMGISGEALEQAKTAMLRAELLLLQRFAGVYTKRDAGAAAQFDMDLMAALAPYYELEGGGIVVTQEQPDEDTSVLESLRAENQRLSDELSVTMETMSRMLNEYSTMFTGGSPGQPGPIAALVGGAMADVSVPDGESAPEPAPGQTAPPFGPDTPVEMAAETDADLAVAAAEDGGDNDDKDMPAQDDIDALFAAESDAPLPDGLGNTEAVSSPPGELDEPIGANDSIDQPLGAHAAHEFDAETDIDASENLEAVAEFLEEEGPAEVISFNESDGFEVELAMQEDHLFDSAESEILLRAEEAAGDPPDDAGAEGSIDVDALFDAADEPVKKHSGH